MIIQVKGIDIKITQAMKEVTNEKLLFLEKFLKENDLVNIKVKKDTKSFKIQISFLYNKQLIFIEKNNIDFYAGLDEICGVIKNKMSKTHNKTISKHKKRINAIRNIEEEEEFIDEVDFIFN